MGEEHEHEFDFCICSLEERDLKIADLRKRVEVAEMQHGTIQREYVADCVWLSNKINSLESERDTAKEEMQKIINTLEADLAAECEAKKETIKEHGITERRNEGEPGMPQGPCTCRVCSEARLEARIDELERRNNIFQSQDTKQSAFHHSIESALQGRLNQLLSDLESVSHFREKAEAKVKSLTSALAVAREALEKVDSFAGHIYTNADHEFRQWHLDNMLLKVKEAQAAIDSAGKGGT